MRPEPRPVAAAGGDVELSLVIPAFNEEGRIEATLRQVSRYLCARGLRHEVIVVDDGSSDGTLPLLMSLAAADDRLRIVALPGNRGKGGALARGVALSRGRTVLICDADQSTPIAEIARLEAALAAGADVAIGSRACPGSRVEQAQPWYRVLMGRTFNLVVRVLLLGGIHDTQCGFKLFSGAHARTMFAMRRIDGFAYDVEVLHLARRHGLTVAEVPVRWAHAEHSRVSPVRHSAQMFRDVLWLRLASRHARRPRPVGEPGADALQGLGSPRP
jgi:dolichyl-phosphate beta-glucosyltransferase